MQDPSVDTVHLDREKSTLMSAESLKIRPATEADVPLLLKFILSIAEYEKLLDEVVAIEETLRESLFG